MIEYVVMVYDGYLYSSLLMFSCALFFLLSLFTAFLSSSSLFYAYFHVLLFLFIPMHYFIMIHLFLLPCSFILRPPPHVLV